MQLQENKSTKRMRLALLAMLATAFAPLAIAQDEEASDKGTKDATVEEVIVTGSRIKRTAEDQMAPTGVISADVFDQRGYVTTAEAMNQFTSNVPALNQAPGNGDSSGTGQQFPNLFNLGTGRTLTLVNSHRFVSSSVGLGDSQVDANIIPTGLLDRIEVVQAGGAAVYGSDAIAGVVNYILKEDFDGFEVDAQYGNGKHGDYDQQNYRATWGMNFDDDRGNIAINAEYASTPSLLFSDRTRSNLSRITQGNPLDTGPNDGIPSVIEVLDAHFWNFNGNGVVYNIPAPPPFALTRINGSPIQFAADGSLIPYDPGAILGIPFAKGGDGFRYSELAGLRTGVDRFNTMLVGHYDVNDSITLRTELLYSHTRGEEIPQGYPRTVLNGPAPPNGAIMIFNFNPFLTDESRNALSAASPAFAAGAPLWLSRHFYYDLFPSNVQRTTTDTYFGLLSAEGNFDGAGREWDWTVQATFGHVKGETSAWNADNEKFANAIFAIPGPGGPACLINFDGDPTNDDSACAPINPFGPGNISPEASAYVSVLTGQKYTNDQFDFLATMGTSLFDLPAGGVQTVFAYEHRGEDADFTPFEANQLGLTGSGIMEIPQSGSYHTNELSAEVLVPIIGGDTAMTGFEVVELSGAYRYVDNSIAGSESVWNLGLRWQVIQDITLRATLSQNFRAPTLTQLLAPITVGANSVGDDPCDSDNITSGSNPDVRLANCQAEWAAHPEYGSLDGFQDPSENFTLAEVTSGGNPDLNNETSDTTTYGIVLTPTFAPGLLFSVDRIEIDLHNGLEAFAPADFMAACYDSEPQPAGICGTFTRAADSTISYPAGSVVTALSTTFNAGIIKYRGEYYVLDYQLPLDDQFGTGPGILSFTVAATHNSKLETAVTGTDFVSEDGTVTQPDWVSSLTINWGIGPALLSYQLYFLSSGLAAPDATIENNPHPDIASNVTQSLSLQWDVSEAVTIRGGVINLTDEQPSYPTIAYGDILGRRWFAGVTARF